MKFNTLGQALHVQTSQQSKPTLGKKFLDLGTEYLLEFPKKDNQIVVSGIAGHQASYDALGISFVRILDSQMYENPETGVITDISGLTKYSIFSNYFYKAQEAQEIAEANEKAKKISENSGNPIDGIALAKALDEIDLAYNGKKAENGLARVAPSKQRLLSYGVDFRIFTECVLIPLDSQLKPLYDKAKGFEIQLSARKQRQLQAMIDNPQYNDVSDPDGFLEVKFSYTGTDIKEAGRKDYQAVEVAHRKIDLTRDENGLYTDPNTKIIGGILAGTSHDSDIIFNRSGTVKYANTIEEFNAAFRKFCVKDAALTIGYINYEDEKMKRDAKELLTLDCAFKAGSKQYNKLLDIVEENKEEAEEEDFVLALGSKALAGATSVGQAVAALDANSELEALVGDELSDLA